MRQFSLEHPTITIEDAYAIQRAWVAQKIKDGRKLVGHKIGLTSRAMQVSSNITEPDYGALLDDMFFDEGTDIPFERFIVPRVEVELAFILGKPLKGPNVTGVRCAGRHRVGDPGAGDHRRAYPTGRTAHQRHPPRCSTPSPTMPPTPGVVMGGRAVRPTEIDLRKVPAVLYRNGVIEGSGVSAAVLNHPAKGVAWLANKLAAYGVTPATSANHPRRLPSPARWRPTPGDTFHVDYDMLRLRLPAASFNRRIRSMDMPINTFKPTPAQR